MNRPPSFTTPQQRQKIRQGGPSAAKFSLIYNAPQRAKAAGADAQTIQDLRQRRRRFSANIKDELGGQKNFENQLGSDYKHGETYGAVNKAQARHIGNQTVPGATPAPGNNVTAQIMGQRNSLLQKRRAALLKAYADKSKQ